MEVMEDTAGLAEKTAEKVADKNESQRNNKQTLHNGEFSNSSLKLESFLSEPSKISISVPEGQSHNKGVPIELDQLVKDSSGYVQKIKRKLHVRLDQHTGNTVVSIIDGNNRDVIRHIPQDKTLAVERLITAPAGMLFRATA